MVGFDSTLVKLVKNNSYTLSTLFADIANDFTDTLVFSVLDFGTLSGLFVDIANGLTEI